MIGNDVVDLDLARRQSNWRRKGFLQKVFSKAEQEIITSSRDPHKSVWLLWSMKEAAYKANQRKNNLPRKLNWLVQQCSIQKHDEDKASGVVRINGEVYFTTSDLTSDYIHTSAETGKSRSVKKSIFMAPSSAAKNFLIKEISEFFDIDPRELRFEKDASGMPFCSGSNSFSFDRFSMSGHGRFTACNLSLINCETTVKHS